MDTKRLKRYIHSIGKDFFVKYHDLFLKENLTNKNIADRIFKETNYSYMSCYNRTSHARTIIRSGKAKAALEIITNSKRINDSTLKKGKKLLKAIK